jgi:hypothetical protein
MMYAVLEWQLGNDETANVVGRDLSEYSANLLVKIAPSHLPREKITMEKLKELTA